ncbi:AI-2E family transporter [Mesobacillus sp. AQ2]|jgi:predicted PurR-regulated permease PerM|uniref:AI-2E family transporter n=1 Tax=Bacillaceae TaxID=186817 RepID=UPI0011AA3820|nr:MULTISPECIES: AI-2E family transporter [Bacillaceae]MCM3121690.1 AI-2E family transporter [Mesobacillus sp. MER 33]MCM3231654.1 AI-2E family transporter [Mesobacillus sp. MER 48]WHX38625.1 AI-2E family transporter [Mesobacillus sp. AQ2]
MWVQRPFFKYSTGLILILLIIFLFGKIDYFVSPLQNFIIAIFFPVLISGLMYYILRKPVQWISRYLPKIASILIVFALVAGLFTALSYFAGSLLGEEISALTENFPEKVDEVTEESQKVINDNKIGIIKADEIKQKALNYLSKLSQNLGENIMTLFSVITSIATVLVVVPFLAFFFLKDDEKLRPYILKHIPSEHAQEGNKILTDIDKTLFTYVTGQFIIALVDGILMYLGYLFIGLDYALLLAVLAMFLTIVPFLGPLLGIIPALFIALTNSPLMALKVLIVLVVVQQLEGNLVTPQVMGKKLSIHPITVILILIAAGSLYGFIGILIAIPLYSVVKIIIKDVWKFYKLRDKKI